MGSAHDNLNRAEKLSVLWSAGEWLAARNLRNSMVHEYQTFASDFLQALHIAHELMPKLERTAAAIKEYLTARIND